MRRIVRWAVLGSFATVAATGCSDAFGIEDVIDSSWELISVSGQAVPGWVESWGTEGMPRLPYIHYERWNFHRDRVGLESLACSIDYHWEDPTHGYDASGTETCSYVLDIERAAISVDLGHSDWLHGSIEGDRMTLVDNDGEVNELQHR